MCDPVYFNYSLTVDNLPSPEGPNCEVISSDTGCFARIAWYDDHSSGVFYETNLGLPRETITVNIERQVSVLSRLYNTESFITFTCGTSETKVCNTLDNLRLSIKATTLPSKGQLAQFDALITPSADFNGSSCYTYVNMTDYCPGIDLDTCDQCFTVVQYGQSNEICGVCLSDENKWNYVAYDSTFYFNRTQSNTIRLVCQKDDRCNSIENIENVRKTLASQVDYDQFTSSAALLKIFLLPLFMSILLGTIGWGLPIRSSNIYSLTKFYTV